MSNGPGNQIVIRPARLEDAGLISVIAGTTFYESYFEQDSPPDLANYIIESFAPEKIAAELSDPSSIIFVAYQSNRAIGYAKLRQGEPHSSVTSANPIELQRIYLLERTWGTGAGEFLLRHCLQWARLLGKDCVWLGVWEENPRGMAFYAKHGFRRVGTLEFPYADTVGINAVMQIDLN